MIAKIEFVCSIFSGYTIHVAYDAGRCYVVTVLVTITCRDDTTFWSTPFAHQRCKMYTINTFRFVDNKFDSIFTELFDFGDLIRVRNPVPDETLPCEVFLFLLCFFFALSFSRQVGAVHSKWEKVYFGNRDKKNQFPFIYFFFNFHSFNVVNPKKA